MGHGKDAIMLKTGHGKAKGQRKWHIKIPYAQELYKFLRQGGSVSTWPKNWISRPASLESVTDMAVEIVGILGNYDERCHRV